jgi:iron complex outermembrane recepter protein
MCDTGKNEPISSVSIDGASQCGAPGRRRGPTWSETMNSPRANVVSLRRRRFTVLRLLLFLVGTLQACWLSAAPGDQGDSLTQLSLEELGNIKVTSVSKEPEQVWKTPAAIYVITQDEIRRSGATSIPEALRLAPGVEVARVDSDHWAIGIRGFGAVLANKLLVLIDGRSVYTPLFGGVYWQVQNIPLEDIDRIEVIRGPGGTIWGANAVDGVINIITKSAKDTHGAMASAGGGNVDQGTGDFRYGSGNGKGLDYRVYGMGFVRAHEFHSDGRNFDDWRKGQGGFRADWTNNRRDSVTLQGDLYDEGAGESTTFALYSPPSQVIADGLAKFSGGDVVGRWKRVLSESSDFQLQAYYDHTNHFEPEFGESRDTYDADFLHHLTLPGHQDFLWGIGARLSPANFAQTVPSIDFLPHHQTDEVYSGFLQDEIPLLRNRVSLTLGSKFEHNNYTGFEVQPDGRLLWTRTPRQSSWASISRAVRTPSRIEEDVQLTDFDTTIPLPIYLRVYGSNKFVAERLTAYETGFRSSLKRDFYLDIALFYNAYADLSSYQVGGFFFEPTPTPAHAVLPLVTSNGIKGRGYGVEVSPDWKPVPWWELRVSYSYLNLDLENKPGSNDPTSVLNYEGSSPRNQVMFQSKIDLPKRFEFDQTYRQVAALPAQSSNTVSPTVTVTGYETADARLGWHLSRQFELSIDGQNLLQPHHAEFGGDPGPLVGIKRCVYAKLTWESRSK